MNKEQWKQAVQDIRTYLSKQETFIQKTHNSFYGTEAPVPLFLTLGHRKQRARVYPLHGNTLETALKKVHQKGMSVLKQQNIEWVKVDVPIRLERCTWNDLLALSAETKKNYLRKGISFDDQFHLAFLEQEIHANGFLHKSDNGEGDEWNMKNLNLYVKNYRDQRYPVRPNHMQHMILFDTISWFYDSNEEKTYELESGGVDNGRRKINDVDQETALDVVSQSSRFLEQQVKRNGRFVYGYFAGFHKEIKWYNILRHCSTLYSMLEAYSHTKDHDLKLSCERALRYVLREAVVPGENSRGEQCLYVVDKENDEEIKLGANAAAILAITKYSLVCDNETYIEEARCLARGICEMQLENGQFMHVLNGWNLSEKERFRIVYYDGEAAFALMRLYALDPDERWLQTVTRAFDYFIENRHWKHHDHWLSYCTNELTKYRPEDKYYQFGLKNVEKKLDFIYHRITAYPTFLELLMASYQMIENMKAQGKEYLLEGFDEEKVYRTIEHRAVHQLNGFFYPELAMYFRKPEAILGSFFIRHHSFRVRIDDIEHNISGYLNYAEQYAPVRLMEV
ncbi:hypothetical protein [Marinococcus sp. PL1-022]|uniref:hypothetical protein n=1 Tax=Marinococcus sp. PL1-022 TaxID=3095363 RepID=UPI0029C540AD|nr:hypothetical protein [Marinococcus sp. PL1-022]MDX6153898.1 hypothetical protein [Marinococcus sp. PL1-022]